MEDKVKEIIQELCDNFMSFTSLDISNLVKKDFPSARHRDIAPIVRSLFSDGLFSQTYIRTLIDVELTDGTPVKTNLYHSQQIDPKFYVNRKQIPIPPKAEDKEDAVSTILTPSVIPDNGFSEDELDRVAKSDGRVEIPISWVRKLNWAPGDQIDIYSSNNKLGLTKLYSGDSGILLTTKITPDGRCRVPKTAFDKIGFKLNGNTLLIRINSDNIEVENV